MILSTLYVSEHGSPWLIFFSFLYSSCCHSSTATTDQRASTPAASRTFPPSPWPLPVIGHIPHFAAALAHRAIRDLARRHNAALKLFLLGELRVVVASSYDAAREIMRTHDLAYATRPVSPTGNILLGEGRNDYGIVSAQYGDTCRQLRRICTAELFTSPCARFVG